MARAALSFRAQQYVVACHAGRLSSSAAKARGDPACPAHGGPAGQAGGATLESALFPPPRPRAFYVPFDAQSIIPESSVDSGRDARHVVAFADAF